MNKNIVYSHFHWRYFRVFCPVCTLCVTLYHRIWFNNRPLNPEDLIFVYSRKGISQALIYQLLRSAILKISATTGLYHCKPHEIKHGVLQDMWSAKLFKICERFEIDLPTYLTVTYHKLDYSQDYIKPDPYRINALVKNVQNNMLESLYDSLTHPMRSDLLTQIENQCPRTVSSFQPQSPWKVQKHRMTLHVQCERVYK